VIRRNIIKIKKDWVRGACSMRRKRGIPTVVLWGNLKERDGLEDLGVGWRVKFINLREIGWDGVNWLHMTGASGKWWALVNTVLSLWVPKISGVS